MDISRCYRFPIKTRLRAYCILRNYLTYYMIYIINFNLYVMSRYVHVVIRVAADFGVICCQTFDIFETDLRRYGVKIVNDTQCDNFD